MNGLVSTAFLYQQISDGIRILKCRSLDTIAEVPKTIMGQPVTQLSSYAFSEQKRLEEGIWTQGDIEDIPELSKERLTQLYLPAGIRKVGAYAFYNCENLEKLSCYSTTLDWGAGAFTGCTGIRELDIHVTEGQKSCLPEILTELHQTLRVVYHGKEEARLIFPEFYEESVENTPARILETHVHGCGHQYRYCFVQSEFQFRGYDSLFPYVKVQEQEELVLELAVNRMRYPYGLTQDHRLVYEEYLSQHMGKAALCTVQKKDIEQLEWLLERYEFSKGELSLLIAEACRTDYSLALSTLMERQRQAAGGVKQFEL